MPSYRVYFDTEKGEIYHDIAIESHETLDEVLDEVLSEVEKRNGTALRGWRGGMGDVVCRWEGRELDFDVPLSELGVRENDVLRVGVRPPSLQVRRDGELFDVEKRAELREGDDILIGRTILRFHIKNQQRKLNKGETFIQRVQEGRSFWQTVYKMTLVGAIAGLACWFLRSLLDLAGVLDDSVVDLVSFTMLGAFIGGLSVGFNDHWLEEMVVPRWVLVGVVAGAIAGALGGFLAPFIRNSIPANLALVATDIVWAIGGASIGAAISSRWLGTNKNRILHGLFGGLFGGVLGGLAYYLLAAGGDWAAALALMLIGAGITFGISLAPVLLRQGVVEFINSGDEKVKVKYKQSRKQWELHQGGRYVIGSLGAGSATTMFAPELSIFIPDRQVEPRHAILTSRDRRYYIEPHHELSLKHSARRGRN